MLDCGGELADRAWSDLARFETRHVARALVLGLTEGSKDCWLRSHHGELRAIRPLKGQVDFGEPEEFVPQKDRVKSQLKSPAGLLQALCKAASPNRWPAFLRNLKRHL